MQRSMKNRGQEANSAETGEQGTSRTRNGPQQMDSDGNPTSRKRTYCSEPSTSTAPQGTNVMASKNGSSTTLNFKDLYRKTVSRIAELVVNLSHNAKNLAQNLESCSASDQRLSDEEAAQEIKKLEEDLKKTRTDLEKMIELFEKARAQRDGFSLMRAVFDGLKGRREKLYSKAVEDCEALFKRGGFCCGKLFDFFAMETCTTCEEQFHFVCRDLGRRKTDGEGQCTCRIPQLFPRKFRSTEIPLDRCAKVMENEFKNWVITDKKVNIRVLTADDMKAELGEMLEKLFVDMGQELPVLKMRNRMILVFLEEKGEEILFFAMLTNEYKEEPKSDLTTFRYLETVNYINDGVLRTNVYNSVILGYMRYTASIGYRITHFWACPPDPKECYLLLGRPAWQRVPDRERLVKWYTDLLELGITRGVIESYSRKYEGPKPNEAFELIGHLISDGGFWNTKIGEFFKTKNGYKKISHRRMRCDLIRMINDPDLMKNNPLFYITLAEVKVDEEIQAKEDNQFPPISSEITKTSDTWWEFLENHGIDFSHKETAIRSTLIILWAVIRELCETGQMVNPQTAQSVPGPSSDSAPSTSSSR